MKKNTLFAVLVLIAFLLVSAYAYNGDTLVYVTRTGECYHRDGCSYLKSRIEITLEDAVNQGYRACSRCHPPILGEDSPTDAKDYSRSAPSSSTSYGASPASTPKPANNSALATSITQSPSNSFSLGFLLSGVAGLLLGTTIINIKRKKEIDSFRNQSVEKIRVLQVESQELKQKIAAFENQKSQMNSRIHDLEKQLYEERFANRNVHDLAKAPIDSEIGSDNLPRLKQAQNLWGKKYTRYISRTGETYHKDKGCCNASIPINVYTIYKQSDPSVRGLRPCRKCNPIMPDLLWVDRWLEIAPSKDEYGLEQFRINVNS